MERGRRNRRGRCNACNRNAPHSYTPPQTAKSGSFLSGLYNFLIMCSLIAIIYMMLEYHCTQCADKCNVMNITKSIEEIAKNLSYMKSNYIDLETKILKFSQDLPKLEGQIDILEALAHTIQKSHLTSLEPKKSIPNIDVFLNRRFNIHSNLTKEFTPQVINAMEFTDNI